MKRKALRIENPFITRPQRLPNLRQRILVAEGQEDIRRLNVEVLIYSGYRTDPVDNGLAAWNTVQIHNYDLMIAAQNLPKVSGVELLRKMHDHGIYLPVILTARILPAWDVALHSWMQGISLLQTPYTLENFTILVKNCLRTSANFRQETAPPPNSRYQNAEHRLVHS